MMRNVVALICSALLLLTFSACSGGGDGKLVGTWDGDMGAVEMDWEAAGIPEEQVDMVREMFSAGEMEITFNADHTYSAEQTNPMTGETEEETGTWEVTERDGDVWTVRMTEDNPDEDDDGPDSGEITFVDNDNMTVTISEDGNDITIPFSRQ